jgi:hypothetical protein
MSKLTHPFTAGPQSSCLSSPAGGRADRMIRLHRFRRLATMPVTCRLDDLPYRIDHQPGLLPVNLVAAVRVGDVLRVWHEPGELLLRLLLRIVGDVAEIRGNVCGSRRRNSVSVAAPKTGVSAEL